MSAATEDTTARKMRQLEEDNIALREDLRRLRADLDVLRSGRLGVLGFKTASLVGDNALNTAKYKDASVTPAKLTGGISRSKLETTESETITVEAGAGYSFPQFQITELGIQILADDTNENPPVILFVPTYADPTYVSGAVRPDVDFWSGIDGNADDADNFIRLRSRNYTGNLLTWYADVLTYADGTNAQVSMEARNNAGTVVEADLIAYAAGLGTFFLTDCMLVLDSETADPSANLFDGALLYRSDTDKFRARVNGAWVNLIDSGDASWVDLTDGGATALHSHAGGGVATDTIWDAKGDLAVGTGADTAARLAVGANGTIPIADSATATGLKYVAQGAGGNLAFGDAGDSGSSYSFIGGGHKHTMPIIATQAEMEAASNLTDAVTPGRVHFHPGVAKVWVQGTPNSTTIISSYNVTSLGDTAIGQQTVTIATDFSSASYTVQVTVGDTSTLLVKSATVMTKAAGSYIMNSVVEAGSGSDPASDWNSAAYGDHA